MSDLMVGGVYYRNIPEFQAWQKDLEQTASFDDVSGWFWLLQRENEQTKQQRDDLLTACERARRGYLNLVELGKLKQDEDRWTASALAEQLGAAIARVRGAQ